LADRDERGDHGTGGSAGDSNELNAQFLRGRDRAHVREPFGSTAFKYREYLHGELPWMDAMQSMNDGT
jgi:hypothetical protein